MDMESPANWRLLPLYLWRKFEWIRDATYALLQGGAALVGQVLFPLQSVTYWWFVALGIFIVLVLRLAVTEAKSIPNASPRILDGIRTALFWIGLSGVVGALAYAWGAQITANNFVSDERAASFYVSLADTTRVGGVFNVSVHVRNHLTEESVQWTMNCFSAGLDAPPSAGLDAPPKEECGPTRTQGGIAPPDSGDNFTFPILVEPPTAGIAKINVYVDIDYGPAFRESKYNVTGVLTKDLRTQGDASWSCRTLTDIHADPPRVLFDEGRCP